VATSCFNCYSWSACVFMCDLSILLLTVFLVFWWSLTYVLFTFLAFFPGDFIIIILILFFTFTPCVLFVYDVYSNK